MATQNEILERLDTAATNAENATDAYNEVLKSEGEQDIPLVDGTTTPNLNKRLKNYISAVKSVQGKTGDIVLTPSDIMSVGSRSLNETASDDIVPELLDENGTRDPSANAQAQALLNKIGFLRGETIYPNYGIVDSEPLKVYVQRLPIQAILKTDGTDETVKLKGYVAAAKSLGKDLVLPKGIILISDTIDIDFTFNLVGAGRDATIIRFNNSTLGKTLFNFKRGGTKSWFKDFTVQEKVLHKSTAVKFSDTRTDVGTPLWKCRFDNIEFIGFNIANHYTSANPLAGADHAHCSENLFINCKFSGNKTWILNQNCQAVNNMYLKCEVENSDTAYLDGQTLIDDNLEFIRDEAGGGFVIVGGSYIGRGRLCGWLYPVGGSNLFGGSGTITITGGTRLECRTTHYGCLFEELTGGNTANSKFYEIFVTDVRALVYGASIDLIRFAGRVGASFDNISTVSSSGRLYVRQYPTLGQSATETTGSLGSISVEDCGAVEYVKATTSPYGNYNQNTVIPVSIKGTRSNSPNASFTLDSKGWAVLFSGGDACQLPYQYGNMKGPSRIVYNRDWTSSGIAAGQQLKFCMPKYGRPLKLFCYKNPTNIGTDHTFTLYVVKDNANWANPSSFNLATDAVSVAVTPSSLNNAGYFEAMVRVGTASFGSPFQAGFGSWLEGRLLIVNNGTTSFSGFVGVDYV